MVRGHTRAHGPAAYEGQGLAEKAGLSNNYLAKRLWDEAPLTFTDVEAICSARGIRVVDLVSETSRLAEDRIGRAAGSDAAATYAGDDEERKADDSDHYAGVPDAADPGLQVF